MKYILAEIGKASAYGFNPIIHRKKDDMICLNEKEVMDSPVLHGDLDQRAETLGGKVYDREETLTILNNKNS